jgi:hypothetical protein
MATARKKPSENKFHVGNGSDGKHYWLTPRNLLCALEEMYGDFDFDPCPFPLPEGFDGLTCEWGKRNYVNPPFGSVMHQGKKKGPTAWARKAILESSKGKKVVFVYPIDKWVLMLLKAGAKVSNLGDIHWEATEDRSPGKGTGRHIAAFILEPKIGAQVNCTFCRRRKKPVGRSAPMELASSLCDHECEGYYLDPKPGHLWPGETQAEFGY